MVPEFAAEQLRKELGLSRAAGGVWIRKEGSGDVVLVVRLSPGFDGIAGRIPPVFLGYPVRTKANVRHLAAT